MKEKLPISFEDLIIEERFVSAQLSGIRNEIKLRQPSNRETIAWLQTRHKNLMGEVRDIHTELTERWNNEQHTKVPGM